MELSRINLDSYIIILTKIPFFPVIIYHFMDSF